MIQLSKFVMLNLFGVPPASQTASTKLTRPHQHFQDDPETSSGWRVG